MKTVSITILMLVLSPFAVGQEKAWQESFGAWHYYDTKTAIDGKTTESAMSEDNSASLVVRCSKVCELFVSTKNEIVADQGSVRVKFNDSTSLKRFTVERGEGSDSLFFRDPMSVLKAMKDNGGYMTVEYSPYQKTPTTARFGIWNLPPSILKRIK